MDGFEEKMLQLQCTTNTTLSLSFETSALATDIVHVIREKCIPPESLIVQLHTSFYGKDNELMHSTLQIACAELTE